MVNRVPVLASRTGGLCEIIGDGPSGVDNFTDVGVWEQRLRDQLDGQGIGPEQLDAAQLRAQDLMKAEPVHIVAKTIETLCAKSNPVWDEKSVAFVGGIDGKESNTIVNGAWARELSSRGYTRDASMDTDLSADHVILHDYSKDFETFVPRKLATILPFALRILDRTLRTGQTRSKKSLINFGSIQIGSHNRRGQVA